VRNLTDDRKGSISNSWLHYGCPSIGPSGSSQARRRSRCRGR
jgi:hypothetical protein